MNVAAVRAALADNARAVPGLNAYGYAPDSVTVPCLYAGEVGVQYDRTFGGDVELEVACYLLVSRADDAAGQAALDEMLAPSGTHSVKAAIEADPSLGGAADDVHISKADGYRIYRVGDGEFYGARLPVRVIGVKE